MKLVLRGLGQLDYTSEEFTQQNIEEGYVNTEVLACAICRTDAKMWEQGHRDLVFPRVLGHELVVKDDTGSRYIVWPGKSCGHCPFCMTDRENLCDDMVITGFHADGGFASSAVLPKDSLIPIPDSVDNHIACFAEPVSCVVNAFEKIRFVAGERVLIYGAGTMGLATALYAKHLGLLPLIIEKNESKIDHIKPFLEATKIPCLKETQDSEFEIVINCCADFIAFCQGVSKVGKGGKLSFFSGLKKNEHIETNLFNLLHYKEVELSGVYGMTRNHMELAVPFMQSHAPLIRMLVEEVIPPQSVPEVMGRVLAGKHLKHIIDFSLNNRQQLSTLNQRRTEPSTQPSALDSTRLSARIIDAIEPVPNDLLSQATAKIDNKTKPLGALGKLENLSIQMSCIQNTLNPTINNKQLFVFAGDHGITEEGVSAYPSEVTAQMVENFLNNGAAINVLCLHQNINMNVVDIGVNYNFKPHKNLLDKKVAKGTGNFAIEDAMSTEQMLTALENGMSVFIEANEKEKIDIVGLGEMGIGNTTSASAIISVITGISPDAAAGRGTGIDDKGLEHKIEVIERALEFHQLNPTAGFEILQKIGGFEIGGIAGAILAAASQKCAVVLDGVISTAAGLIAYSLNPEIKGYLIAGHKSVEVAHSAALAHMDLEPLMDFQLRLGEGTGAALAIDLTDAACKIMVEMASFDDAKVARSKL